MKIGHASISKFVKLNAIQRHPREEWDILKKLGVNLIRGLPTVQSNPTYQLCKFSINIAIEELKEPSLFCLNFGLVTREGLQHLQSKGSLG